MKTLQDKLDNLDVLFELGAVKKPLFQYEKVNFPNKKVFIFKYFKVDEAARSRKLADINQVLLDNNTLEDLAGTTEKLKTIDESIEYQGFAEFGKAEVFIENNELVVEFKTVMHEKEFRFKGDETLDSVLFFIQNEIGEEAKQLSMK